MELRDGLEYALNLNYTKNQYEQAITRIPSNFDHNQLLNALVKSASSDLNNDQSDNAYGSGSMTQNNDQLRLIFIDGQNVGKFNAHEEEFSWRDVKACFDYFHQLGHDVTVIMPVSKCEDTKETLDENLRKNIMRIPPGSNDDLFLLEIATKNDGIIVSNDQFRDETRNNERYSKKFVDSRRLSYSFWKGNFEPYPFPHGQSLENFLKVSTILSRSKSDNSYGRNRRKLATNRSSLRSNPHR